MRWHGARGHFPTTPLNNRARTILGSKMHRWPLLDLDSCDENCLTLAVRTKYLRLAVRQAGHELRKCSGNIRKMSQNHCVRGGWKVCHLLLQPGGLGRRATLHTLTVIPKFGRDLGSAELTQPHGFESAIGGAREHVADRNT